MEETPEAEERENTFPPLSDKPDRKMRPGTLQISDSSNRNPKSPGIMAAKKQLHRSNSSTLHYRPKPKPMKEYEQFYFTSTNGKSNNADEFLQIINERRKILKSESTTESSLDVKDSKVDEVETSTSSKSANLEVEEEGNVIPSEMELKTITTILPSQECISRNDINSECTSEKSTNNTAVLSSSTTTIALIHEMPIENSEIVSKDTCHTADKGEVDEKDSLV